MSGPRLMVVGERGLFAGVESHLAPGEVLCVGRSRAAGLSAVLTPVALRIGREALEHSDDFRRMSRRHFELAYEGEHRLVIADHSTNGILVDGRRVRNMVLDPADLPSSGTRIRFGAGEELRLMRAP